MLMFINDDRAYLYWITHHREGFVLDGKRKPRVSHLVIHRATCGSIKSVASWHGHWTAAGRLKACSVDREELESWAMEEAGSPAEHCAVCKSKDDVVLSDEHIHLSKLPSDILEYILEAALIHLEIEHPPYRLTVADIAACFGKTPGQVSQPLHRLRESGLIIVKGHVAAAGSISPKRIVLPTAAALRTLAAFQSESDSTIDGELAKLEPA
jgi:DNA-binding transcriptional ArsR family regulator